MWLFVAGAAALVILYRLAKFERSEFADRQDQARKSASWRRIAQKGQVIIGEPFISISGYPIAADGRDFMYAPGVDQYAGQVENPQVEPIL